MTENIFSSIYFNIDKCSDHCCFDRNIFKFKLISSKICNFHERDLPNFDLESFISDHLRKD